MANYFVFTTTPISCCKALRKEISSDQSTDYKLAIEWFLQIIRFECQGQSLSKSKKTKTW